MPFKSESQRRYLWANEPEIARRWSNKYGRKAVPNKGGNKGSTGAGKGFSTWHQAGTKGEEDSPGWDPRTQGDRRYGAGARFPGGKKSKRGNVSQAAIMKRLTKSKKRKGAEDNGDRVTYADTENYKGGRTNPKQFQPKSKGAFAGVKSYNNRMKRGA